MARQAFLWTLPLAIFLGFLWYKRKKSILKSDPGCSGDSEKVKLVDSNTSFAGSSLHILEENQVISGEVVEVSQVDLDAPVDSSSHNEALKSLSVQPPHKHILGTEQTEGSHTEISEAICEGLEGFTEIPECVPQVEGLQANAAADFCEVPYTYKQKNAQDTAEPCELTESVGVVDPLVGRHSVCEEVVVTISLQEVKEDNPEMSGTAIGVVAEKLVPELRNEDVMHAIEQAASVSHPADVCKEAEVTQVLSHLNLGDIKKIEKIKESVQAVPSTVARSSRAVDRDSANHSPADVMLGSPSISIYSDAQSEGSSDSGKGCSYVATPPSRTPASGSSDSGDVPVPSVYEFILAQHLVGRLIGRHGCFVHQIKAKTRANILIKRHPDTPKLKICAVEGTPMDIEAALEMVRQKFPEKRYPDVTLEQVCFVPPVSRFPIIPEYLQLQLVEGVNNDVFLSCLVSPVHFFLQQPTHPTFPALNCLSTCMSLCYSESSTPALPCIEAGIICAAPATGRWYRAQIVSVNADTQACDVKLVDYGGYLQVDSSALRQIRSDFMTLPFQAAECYLANVSPVGGCDSMWGEASLAGMEALTKGHVLQAQVCGYAEDGLPVVYLFSIHGTQVTLSGRLAHVLEVAWHASAMSVAQVVPIHQELVARGLAEWWEPSDG